MADDLLLLGEGNFAFTQALVEMGIPPLITSDFSHEPDKRPCTSVDKDGLVTIRGLDATRIHLDETLTHWSHVNDPILACAWNFPFTGSEEDDGGNEALLLGTFLSLALFFKDQIHLGPIKFGVSLQGDQFSRWCVQRSARRAGWKLTSWAFFEYNSFPGYAPARANGNTFSAEHLRWYFLLSCFLSFLNLSFLRLLSFPFSFLPFVLPTFFPYIVSSVRVCVYLSSFSVSPSLSYFHSLCLGMSLSLLFFRFSSCFFQGTNLS
jgi:hypothetical protein